MTDFDLRTVVILSGLMGALLSMVLYFLRRSYPPSIRGMRDWALGPLLAGLSTVFVVPIGAFPELVTAGMSNLLVLGGGYMLLRGTWEHFGHARPRWALVLLWAVAFPALVWASAVAPSYDLRLFILSGVLACYLLGMLWAIRQQSRRSFAVTYTSVVLGAMSLVMLLRMLTSAYMPAGQDLMGASFFQSLYVIGMSVGLLMLSIGFVLLATDQLRLELENIITHDMLTGALARRALFSQGHAEIARSQRSGQPTTVLMLDLDRFKAVNDTHGHLAGDAVLRDFSQRCMALLRPSDLFCRYGGEEFVVLLPDTAAAEALHIAERLRQSRTADSDLPTCTVSIGLAALAPGEVASLQTLINRADTALYAAKRNGRNRIEVASPTELPLGAPPAPMPVPPAPE